MEEEIYLASATKSSYSYSTSAIPQQPKERAVGNDERACVGVEGGGSWRGEGRGGGRVVEGGGSWRGEGRGEGEGHGGGGSQPRYLYIYFKFPEPPPPPPPPPTTLTPTIALP